MELSTLLVNSSAKFRKEALAMPVATLLQGALKHMTLHRGVAGDETVGAVGSGAEVRPYRSEKGATDTSRIVARKLTTFLGDVLEEFDPYILFTTVFGEQFTDKTKRTEAEIVQKLTLAMGKSVAKKLGAALFKAVRNDAGTKTVDLFNGFDTIAAAEISAGNIAVAKGNLFEHETITAANVGDVLRSIYDAASEELQEADNLKMFLPKSIKKMYDDWCLAHFGAVVYNTTYNKNRLHGTDEYPCELVALSGMKDSNFIYLSTKENMLVGCDQESNREKVLVRVPDNPKVVQFFMCFFWGVQFQMIEPEYLLVAKPAAAPAPVTITGDTLIDNLAATQGTNVRTYATSDGSAISAEVLSENSDWLGVSVEGKKVTFSRSAFAYNSEGTSPRVATVRISSGSAYLDVTVKQVMASE